jgi:hypothetical protein
MVSAPRLTPLFRERGQQCVRFVRTKAEESACPGSDRARSRPVTEQVPPIVKMAIILAPRCGPFPWNLNHQGSAFDRWIQCWVRKSGCVCPINPAITGRKPSPTTMPPFFGWLRKAVFYQRTGGSSSAKESQEAPRESMCSTNIHARTQMQLINSGRAQITYLVREAQIVQSNVRQQESYQQL